MVTVETPSSLSISKVPTLSHVSEEKAAPCKSKMAFNWLQKVILKKLKNDYLKSVQTKNLLKVRDRDDRYRTTSIGGTDFEAHLKK